MYPKQIINLITPTNTMTTQSQLQFVYHRIKNGYGRSRIADLFYREFPGVDFVPVYEEAIIHRDADALSGFAENRTGAVSIATKFKVVTNALAGKDVQLYINGNRSTDIPCFQLSTSMVKGHGKHIIYEGNDPYVARDVVIRATVCSEAQKRELKTRLPRGFNVAPGLDGNFILFGRDHAKRYEGDLNECLEAVFHVA